MNIVMKTALSTLLIVLSVSAVGAAQTGDALPTADDVVAKMIHLDDQRHAQLDSAVRQVQGNVGNKDALRAAMMKADFKSLRGGFKFNTNHYPIQDFYLVKVAKRADGKFETEIVKKVFENYADPHAKDCAMK